MIYLLACGAAMTFLFLWSLMVASGRADAHAEEIARHTRTHE